MSSERVLVLCGSGEFTPVMEEVDSFALSLVGGVGKVGIVPTAAGAEPDYRKWVLDGVNHFGRIGFEAFGLDVKNREQANSQEFSDKLKDASLIYFSGGDPGYLLHSLRDTLFLRTVVSLYENGVGLAGSSAGAMVMGRHVLTNPYQCIPGEALPVWEQGMGLVDFSVIPHYDYLLREEKESFEYVMENTSAEYKTKLLCIEESTALVIKDSEARVLGKGRVILLEGGREEIHSPKDRFFI